MKPLILYSSKNPASLNIAKQMDGTVEMVDVNDNIVYFQPPETNRDYYIVLSSHSSRSGIPSATVHVPGNWGKAELGGLDDRLCISYPSKMLDIISRYAALRGRGFEITYEVDHHGPFFSKPVMFVELGSDERYWNDVDAAKIIARAVLDSIDSPNQYDVYFGIDGTHYVPKLTKYSLDNSVAYSHLLARYQNGFRDEMFRQAIELSVEKVDGILVAKKAVDSSQKEYIKKFGESYGIDVKFI